MKLKIAVYVRVSTQRQAQDQTIDQQLTQLQNFCEAKGWDWSPEQIFRDDGYSGSTLKRPALDQLRDRLSQAHFDLVLITCPDRLARKFVHQMLLLEEFEGHGCQVQFSDQPLSHSPHDQLLVQVRGAVAEYERSLITERLRRGRLHKYRSGTLLPWTKPPYGYLLNPDHPRNPAGVMLEPTEAAVVLDIFTRYLQPQQSLWGLANYLTQTKLPTPGGRAYWNKTTVRWILTNPVYTGTVYAERTRHQPARQRYSALAPIGSGSTSVYRSSEEWIEVGQVPAIVSKEEFELVQQKLTKNQQEASRNNTKHQYLLRAMLSCGWCKLSYHCRTVKQTGYYRCNGKDPLIHSGLSAKCPSRYLTTQYLDELIWQDLCEVVKQPALLEQALQRCNNGEWLSREIGSRQESLKKAQSSLHNQLERLTQAYLGEVLNLEEYKRRRGDLEQRQVSITQQLEQLKANLQNQLEVTKIGQSIEEFCKRVSTGLEKASFEQKRQLVELLIDRVIISGMR